ncbi:acetyl-CoA carboxylase carboxyltransferase subunit alpha [Nonomuraea sp. CA-141351]|uniref:acetyl-CoA carboxylase carboxyltransferase subunit alpha n=1 Tax=Nonomuraea sp. CA-141351 TaxID=3239996 RepID=UPI003D921607
MTIIETPAAQLEKWTICGSCGTTIYVPRLVRSSHVCPECGHNHRIGAEERLRLLVDAGSFHPGPQVGSLDPLAFADSRPYPERLVKARSRTGLTDAMLYGTAAIGGKPAVVAVMDFAFLGGSMGSAVGETVVRAAEEAETRRRPLVIVTASGGARMQEGVLSLMQMAKTAQALERLRASGVLTICVLTDPTFGGVTASFATLADVLIAERGSLIGFAGPRVIAAATRQSLPDGFQTAEYLMSQGMLDRVEPREGIRPLLTRLLGLHAGARRPEAGSPASLVRDPGSVGSERSAWETVRLARDVNRPTTLDYVWQMCTDFVELHGDRTFGDDPAIVGGIASLDGVSVMIIGHQKGHDTKELVARNFGMAHPEGYRKALRLMRLAETLGLPIVTLIDTQGAAPGIGAEERGQAWAIAECIAGMSRLTVPVVATVTGEGGSGGALALGVANTVFMMENACYSVISPESCSTILHGDPSHGAEMAEALRITAPELLRLGVIDAMIREPDSGAQASPAEAAASLKTSILAALAELRDLDGDELRTHRYRRFRVMGAVSDG